MKNLQFNNINFRSPIFILIIVHVNGSLLSRMKTRYEYLPLPLEEYNAEDSYNNITDEVSPKNISKTVISVPLIIKQETLGPDVFSESLTNTTVKMGSSKPNSEFLTPKQDSKFQKRTINTETEFYYDQDKWPAVKLFVALRSTRFPQTLSAPDPTKRRKKTWPPHFPPKIISKLQAELDDALLPWKSTKAIGKNVANLTEDRSDATLIMRNGSVTYCYMCGLDIPGIPRMPGCYHIFENDDYRTRKLQQKYKVKCITSTRKKRTKNKLYGTDYTGGCFKRFLDVGVEYNERGCRTKEPTRGKSYASKRLAYLERLLKYTDNGCVFSPFASLTPFSRAISLYARYHVCVCDTKYCNQAFRIVPLNIYMWFSLTLYLLINYYDKE